MMGKTSLAGDVMTRRLKSTWGAISVSFLSFSKALCVWVSHDLCSVSLIYCCLSCYKSSNIECSRMSKPRQRQRNMRAKADHVQVVCSSLPTLHQTSGDTHSLCLVWLGVKRAESALEGADCPHCEWLPLRTLHSRKTLFEEGVFTSVSRGTSTASAEAEQWLCSWESQMDQMEGLKTGKPLSSSFPIRSSLLNVNVNVRSSARSLRSEARSAVLPTGERAPCSTCLLPRRGKGRTSPFYIRVADLRTVILTG